MNTKIIIAVLVLLLGAGVWFGLQNDTQDMQQADAPELQQSSSKTFTTKETLKALYERGDALECTFEQVDEEGQKNEGVAYIADGKFRVNAQSEHDGMSFDSGMIYNNTSVHAWTASEEGTFGFMFAIPEDELFSGDMSQDDTQGVNLQDEASFSCAAWKVDESVFMPPSDIEFVDMAAMFEDMFTQ